MRCLLKCSVASILGVVVFCLIFTNLYVEHNYVLDKRSTIWKLICRESPTQTSGQFPNRVTNGNISPVQKRLTSSQQSHSSESNPLHSRTDPTHHDKEVVKQVNRETASHQLTSEQHVHGLKDCYNFLASINISYHYLAGTPLREKRYLTIGLSIVKQKKESYLLETIKSIFEHSIYEEWEEMAVVIHLAEFDSTWCDRMVHNISQKFAYHIITGRLMVIHTPKEYYSALDGLKRNDNNFEDRVKIRSKQNVGYAFLLNFCANLSDYYIMLEDNIQSGKHFFTILKEFISSLKGTQWVTLEFSKLGFPGKLYHSQDLPRLTHFLLMFYQEMSCDLLLTHFCKLLAPNEAIHFRPPLFKRFGYKRNKDKLKDDELEQDPVNLPDNQSDM